MNKQNCDSYRSTPTSRYSCWSDKSALPVYVLYEFQNFLNMLSIRTCYANYKVPPSQRPKDRYSIYSRHDRLTKEKAKSAYVHTKRLSLTSTCLPSDCQGISHRKDTHATLLFHPNPDQERTNRVAYRVPTIIPLVGSVHSGSSRARFSRSRPSRPSIRVG